MIELSYRRHRFRPVVIQHAVWLYLRFTLSYRGCAGISMRSCAPSAHDGREGRGGRGFSKHLGSRVFEIFRCPQPDPRDDGPHRRSNSEYRISLCNEQATYTVIAREYSSTTQLTRRFGICFRSTNYDSDRCARLCKCRNASFSKRDYGQCDGNYGQHDFGVDVHIALPFLTR